MLAAQLHGQINNIYRTPKHKIQKIFHNFEIKILFLPIRHLG